MNEDIAETAVILVLKSFCSTISAGSDFSTADRTNESENILPDRNGEGSTRMFMDPAAMPLWCDLTVLPEIPLDSIDGTNSPMQLAATYIIQQELNSCGIDNVVLLNTAPLLSKSGGYFLSLSSCQTKVNLNGEFGDDTFLPVEAIPSTFLMFMEDSDQIVREEFTRPLHHNQNGGIMEFEVIFEFSEAEFLIKDILVSAIRQNISFNHDKEWTGNETIFDSTKHFGVSESPFLERHDQLLLVIKTLAEREARELNKTLTGLAAIAVALIGGYFWLSFSILRIYRKPKAGRKSRMGVASGFVNAEKSLTFTGFDLKSPKWNTCRGQATGSLAHGPSKILSSCISGCPYPSNEGEWLKMVTLVQSHVRMKIACNEATHMLALVIQLQSIIRGYFVRRNPDKHCSKRFNTKWKSSIHTKSPPSLVNCTSKCLPNHTSARPGIPTIARLDVDLRLDNCHMPIELPSKDNDDFTYFNRTVVMSDVDRAQSDSDKGQKVPGTCLDTMPSHVNIVARTMPRRSFVTCVHQTSSESLPLKFAHELQALLASRCLLDDEAIMNSPFEAEDGRRQVSGSQTVPLVEKSHSPVGRQSNVVNEDELSPMSKITAKWATSKNTRRKNRRPSSNRLIAPISNSYDIEGSISTMKKSSLLEHPVLGNTSVAPDSNEHDRYPFLVPTLSEGSPNGSSSSPKSVCDPGESFLQDYW